MAAPGPSRAPVGAGGGREGRPRILRIGVLLGGKIIDQHLERLSVAAGFRRREGAKLQQTLKG